MTDKETLHRYLRRERASLLSKLDGLSERDVRWPMTATGTNLLGLVKHVASVEVDYFGAVFDRPFGRELPWFVDGAEVNADMWATAEETRADIVELFQAAAAHADATIEALGGDAVGRVPWWSDDRAEVTLQQILVHMNVEMARHAGHADILRELLVGSTAGAGVDPAEQTPEEWQAYRQRLEAVALSAAD